MISRVALAVYALAPAAVEGESKEEEEEKKKHSFRKKPDSKYELST